VRITTGVTGQRVHCPLTTGTPEQRSERHTCRTGHRVGRTGGLSHNIAEQCRFRVNQHRERTVIPQRINFREIGDVHVAGLQATQAGDDVEPEDQRVFVPVNVVERAGCGPVTLT
jgi:hypothetical protein